MSELAWILNVTIFALAAINTIVWGYAIREAEEPSLLLGFLFRLIFNKWFILAMIIAMITAFVGIYIKLCYFKRDEYIDGKFFLPLQNNYYNFSSNACFKGETYLMAIGWNMANNYWNVYSWKVI
ncbi:hypothetical protein BA065_02055 [Nanoarchaeota archaeon NZ13-N]|nr:MAG: hypothetical protein BA065_02055 [Nanoarchaeota archaeon NZ13-N]